MLWFLTLHIAALLFWLAGLLYLPILLSGVAKSRTEIADTPHKHSSVGRFLFTQIATPAALLAIAAGTVVFFLDGNTEPWLILKLALVTLLVACHAGCGLLVLRAEREAGGSLQPWSSLLLLAVSILTVLIIWLVLAKPPLPEELTWPL